MMIKKILYEKIPISINSKMIDNLNKMVMLFEIRGEHPLTLNSQLYGVHQFVFTPADREQIFSIIGYPESYVKAVIDSIHSINKDYNVVSDPFSIICVYLSHLIINLKINEKVKHDCAVNILNYMQYRFFTSFIRKSLKHNADENAMRTTIESLNLKFDIKQYESWREVIVARSNSIIFSEDTHLHTILRFDNDAKILYVISDINTKLRRQLVAINVIYYDIKYSGNYISSHSSTVESDGEKILVEKSNEFASLNRSVIDRILNKRTFIDEKLIAMTLRSVTRLNANIIRRMLSVISDIAKYQESKKELYEQTLIKDLAHTTHYDGIGRLVEVIIDVVYRSAIDNRKVNINNKIMIYNNAKNVFSAPRTTNKSIINIRNSFKSLCMKNNISTRESTISGLCIVFILYVTLTSFSEV